MTCKDCIHWGACERMISDTSKMFKVLLSEILKMNCGIKYDSTNILSGAEICQCFQDRSRFVELPSDGVMYGVLNGKPIELSNFISPPKGNELFILLPETINVPFYKTREEAEQALKEREGIE